jgi:hypothetical protein
LIAELRARREARDLTAIGVLTHHLIMDRATEYFMTRLGETIAAHPAARWIDARELLPELTVGA